MIRSFILSKLASEEKKLGASLDYLRHILNRSLTGFFKFARLMGLATYRKSVPVDAYYVARLVATQHEDCGSCVQIEVNLAKQEGVSVELLKATLAGDLDRLGEDLADVYRFTQAVVTANGEDEPLRLKLIERFGEDAMIDLAFGITAARAFPTTKRVLGYAKSCSVVKVDF